MIDLTQSQLDSFRSSLRAGQYNLLLGAGVSLDSTNRYGQLPSGGQLRDELCKVKGVSTSKALQKVFGLLNPDEIQELITNRFSDSTPGPTLRFLSKFLWKRIFTWNIDDATEKSYEDRSAKQSLVPVHFRDAYLDERSISELLLIKLHGSVNSPEKGYVFSRDEYIQIMKEVNPWMAVLSQYISSQPFIIAGASMDEVDLDYYLSFRSTYTGRDDQGPSILVEPYPDSVTLNECEKHNLLLFTGTALEFFQYCDSVLPMRPTPLELIPAESANLLSDSTPQADALRFYADFELVPSTAMENVNVSPFLYGHPPSWRDMQDGIDVSRNVSTPLLSRIEGLLANTADENRILLISDIPGTGKTTLIKRAAFELSGRGYRCLWCSALSRLESDKTTSIIDNIDGPLVIFVDDFAEQVSSIGDIVDRTNKKDIVFVVSERSYRFRYIVQSLSGVSFERVPDLVLRANDIDRLVENYSKFGLVANYKALKQKEEFHQKVIKDPIAVACCRILNDFRPVDRIANSLLDQCDAEDQNRYLIAALAQNCFAGGLRYEILAKIAPGSGLRQQLMQDHPLPLTFYDKRMNTHVVPQNAVIGESVLRSVARTSPMGLKRVFVELANELAPRVNRRTIKQRSPEARLSGRLFDFDSVVELFLGDLAEEFYRETREPWQWNSRYWEQTALMSLSRARRTKKIADKQQLMDLAVRNASHAVSLENHAFPLTTLAKIQFARMTMIDGSRTQFFSDAIENASKAIRLETGRRSPHPYVTLLRGAIEFGTLGGVMSSTQIERVRQTQSDALKNFPKDKEVADLVMQSKLLI